MLIQGEPMEMTVSAYSGNCPIQHTGRWTAIGGSALVQNGCAVDPKIIPLGSRLYIPGYGWKMADDTGRKIKGYRIDLRLGNRKECIQFGMQTMTVHVRYARAKDEPVARGEARDAKQIQALGNKPILGTEHEVLVPDGGLEVASGTNRGGVEVYGSPDAQDTRGQGRTYLDDKQRVASKAVGCALDGANLRANVPTNIQTPTHKDTNDKSTSNLASAIYGGVIALAASAGIIAALVGRWRA